MGLHAFVALVCLIQRPCFYVWERLDDGTCRMYYTGQGADGSTAIGVAKLSVVDGPAEWVREQAKLSFSTVE